MSEFLEQIEHVVDSILPDKDELVHKEHPKTDYIMLIVRNLLVGVATVFFLLSFFFEDAHHILRAVGYFSGAGFRVRVAHKELFMVYCLGPLYLIMGLGYVLK